MATTKTHTADVTGPADLNLSGGAVNIEVIADDTIEHAQVDLYTADDEGPAADAVRNARIDASGNRISLRLPQDAGSVSIGGDGFISVVNGGMTVIGGNSIQIGGMRGNIRIGGMNINASGGVVIPGISPIVVSARVPSGSSATLKTISGDIDVCGQGSMATVNADSTSGFINVETAHTVHAKTMSGGVRVRNLTGRGNLTSMSGNIEVYGPEDVPCVAQTMSGDVIYNRLMDVNPSTMSGRVRPVKM